MRYSASEKFEIIELVEQSVDLNRSESEFIPSWPTTGRLGISRGKHTERLCEACVQINQTHE
jgi:hypothetical protein